MLELQEHTGKLKVENYGLWEFLQDLQQGVNRGYELDDSNEGFPQTFGQIYTCLLKQKKKIQEPLFKPLIDLHPGLQEELDAIVIEPEVVASLATNVAEKETNVALQATDKAKTEVVAPVVPQVNKRAYVSKGNGSGTGPKPRN